MLTTPTTLAISLTLLAADPIGVQPGVHPGARTTTTTQTAQTPVMLIPNASASALPGVTRPARDATLGVPFDGLITTLPVREGTRVRKGEVIAVLDDRVAREAVRVSETDAAHDAGVVRAKAVLERATDAYCRAEEAHTAGALNAEQYEEAKNRRDVAEADLQFAQEVFDKAQAQLALTRAQLEEHTIRAPFDGVIVRVHAEAGEVLSPGEPLADLLMLDRTMVDLHLPAEVALGLRSGDRVALDIADPIGAVAAARVVYAEPRVDATSKASRVVFEIEPTAFSIPAGVLVTPADRLPDEADTERFAALAERSGQVSPIAAAE
jgi:RND family efflux transporter MFP subunit